MARPGLIAIAILTLACTAQREPATAAPRRDAPAVARPPELGADAADRPVAPAAAPDPCCDRPTTRDQPPEVKVKLGHYSNARRGIGLVFDRTTAQPKLRFDGTTEIVKLDGQPGGSGRIDYIRRVGHVVLQQWGNGRTVVFVAGDGIEVRRDGDADPL